MITKLIQALEEAYPHEGDDRRTAAFQALLEARAFDAGADDLKVANPAALYRIAPALFAKLTGQRTGGDDRAKVERAMMREAAVQPLRPNQPKRTHATLEEALAAVPASGPYATDAQKVARAMKIEQIRRAYSPGLGDDPSNGGSFAA